MTSPVLSRMSSVNEKQREHDDSILTHTESREADTRLGDNLELLRAEDVANRDPTSRNRSREPEDAFNAPSPAIGDGALGMQQEPKALNKLWQQLKRFPRIIRYFTYMIPVGAILMAPILIEMYRVTGSTAVGGVHGPELFWFGIWLEVIWLSFWAARASCTIMPLSFGVVAKVIGSVNHKKWKDIGRHLELHMALLTWTIGLMSSYTPILDTPSHRVGCDETVCPDGHVPEIEWIYVVRKLLIAGLTLAALNLVEKIIIQWIAGEFHTRTYSYRIQQNKAEIDYLVHLFEYAKKKGTSVEGDSGEGWGSPFQPNSGARTPMQAIQKNARQALSKMGDAANKVAGDFTGRKYLSGSHPRRVVAELLRNTPSAHTLARLIYRTFASPDREHIVLEDLQAAFLSLEEAEACFSIFDKDLNGDISMQELEMTCNDTHLEKKAIAASLKDLDSVISKLDDVFMVIIVIIAAVVLISIISNSAAAALTSTGTTLLGLAWVLQATAQEFLQSIIFVFVKHPFDVGDRVTVYGNTGSLMKGDDYYVQEISLLYTEFKKMEGHVVQAPNSLLNTLFILNQRRSSALADPIELKLRYGTPNAVIEELKARMTLFVLENKRDYAPRVITEVRTIDEVWSVTINFIFFHKSSFQNELLRLQRHNKFAAELMHQMGELGIEGPRRRDPGGARDFPFYYTVVQPPAYTDDQPNSAAPFLGHHHYLPPFDHPAAPGSSTNSVGRNRASSTARLRAESRATVFDSGPDFQDVFDNRRPDHTIARGGVYEARRAENPLGRLQSVRSGEAIHSAGVLSDTSVDHGGSPIEKQRTVATQDSDRMTVTHSHLGLQTRRVFGRPRGDSRASGNATGPGMV